MNASSEAKSTWSHIRGEKLISRQLYYSNHPMSLQVLATTVDDLPMGLSHPGIKKPPSTSKRHKLFRKLTLRFRP
jgi:hypothetical protein